MTHDSVLPTPFLEPCGPVRKEIQNLINLWETAIQRTIGVLDTREDLSEDEVCSLFHAAMQSSAALFAASGFTPDEREQIVSNFSDALEHHCNAVGELEPAEGVALQ